MKRATCTHLIRGADVLLAYQQFKIVGLKGYGGVINDGEDPLLSACREIGEESGGDPERRINPKEDGGIIVRPEHLRKMALVDYYNGTEADRPFGDPSFRVLFLEARIFIGTPISTREMRDPRWCKKAAKLLPVAEMIPGDELVIPRILAGQHVKGWIRRTSDFRHVLNYVLRPCLPEDLAI